MIKDLITDLAYDKIAIVLAYNLVFQNLQMRKEWEQMVKYGTTIRFDIGIQTYYQ
jgi:hypothetical protein